MKENLFKALIDARIIEATKKKTSLKLLSIAENLGSPIIGSHSTVSLLPDFYEEKNNTEEISDSDEYGVDSKIGYVYDSLKHGHNMEIVVMQNSDRSNSSIKATYDGNIVFLEQEGDLRSYVPNKIWEDHIEVLYGMAKKIMERKKTVEVEEMKQKSQKIKKSFMEKLKLIWGYE